jgi:hypothetical protein
VPVIGARTKIREAWGGIPASRIRVGKATSDACLLAILQRAANSPDRGREPATSPNVGSMIFTLILKNERRDSLVYLRVVTVFKLLRLVRQALEMGPWTHIEISTS